MFAAPVTSCGDVNGDGYDDFTLGDPSFNGGSLLVYYGGPLADNLFDKKLYNPGGGAQFGLYTPRNAGDFNGDGINDLALYHGYSKTIYVYYGSSDFDQYYDFSITDTAITNWNTSIDFVNNIQDDLKSDILLNARKNGQYHFHGYSWNFYQNQGSDYVLNSDLYLAGMSVASGDFNNDGTIEIFAGSHFDRNHGSPGGKIYLYDTLNVSVNNPIVNSLIKSTHLFPNPAYSQTMLFIESTENGIINVRIWDITGAIHMENEFRVSPGANYKTINTNALKPGTYILQIQQKSFDEKIKFIVIE